MKYHLWHKKNGLAGTLDRISDFAPWCLEPSAAHRVLRTALAVGQYEDDNIIVTPMVTIPEIEALSIYEPLKMKT